VSHDLASPALDQKRVYRPTDNVILGRPALVEHGIYHCMSGGLFFLDLRTGKEHRVAAWPPDSDAAYAGDVSIAGDGILVRSGSRISAYTSAEGGAP
jgi:hypothetical protein